MKVSSCREAGAGWAGGSYDRVSCANVGLEAWRGVAAWGCWGVL